MNIVYVKSESTVKPDVVSIEKTAVYLRRNIVEEIRMYDDVTTETFYVYEEAKLSHEEFSKYSNEIAAINAVRGMNDSDNIAKLIVNGSDSTDNQLILMEAIADLYDVIAGMI
jgi:hypothetical protein